MSARDFLFFGQILLCQIEQRVKSPLESFVACSFIHCSSQRTASKCDTTSWNRDRLAYPLSSRHYVSCPLLMTEQHWLVSFHVTLHFVRNEISSLTLQGLQEALCCNLTTITRWKHSSQATDAGTSPLDAVVSRTSRSLTEHVLLSLRRSCSGKCRRGLSARCRHVEQRSEVYKCCGTGPLLEIFSACMIVRSLDENMSALVSSCPVSWPCERGEKRCVHDDVSNMSQNGKITYFSRVAST